MAEGLPQVGTELPTITATATLQSAVRYAGASCDFNPLHFSADAAAETSPTGGIIVHGMYAMGLVSRLVTEWAGGPEAVVDISVRFTEPWPLETTATFGGRVSELDGRTATVQLWAELDDGERILRGRSSLRLG